MGLIRKILFFVSIVLIILPLLQGFYSLEIIPIGSFFILEYSLWVLIGGIILLIAVFFSWRAERKRLQAMSNFPEMSEKQMIEAQNAGQWPSLKQ